MTTKRLALLVAVLAATGGAAGAADLPAGKAAPIEYVQVCTAFGTGYFTLPGTDTCLKVGGLVRANYAFYGAGDRSKDATVFSSTARVNFDARTQTDYGPLRSFIELAFDYNSGTTTPSLRYGY